ETGTILTAAHVGHYLLARRDKLPIDKFTTHDLRRTVATMLAEMGIGLDLVAAVVGHEAGGKETRTLVRHYVRTDLIERKVHVLRTWDERLQNIVAGGEASQGVRPLRAGWSGARPSPGFRPVGASCLALRAIGLAGLRIRSEPYWRGLENSFALCYRRRGRRGTWLAQRRSADGGNNSGKRTSLLVPGGLHGTNQFPQLLKYEPWL